MFLFITIGLIIGLLASISTEAMSKETIIIAACLIFSSVCQYLISKSKFKFKKSKPDLKTPLINNSISANEEAVMLIDSEFNIQYVNNSFEKFLQEHESRLRKIMPSLKVEEIIGSDFLTIYRNVSHKRESLGVLTRTMINEIRVGKETYRLIINPIYGSENLKIGFSIKWEDYTYELENKKFKNNIDFAIDSVDRNIMLLNSDLVITFINKSLNNLLADKNISAIKGEIFENLFHDPIDVRCKLNNAIDSISLNLDTIDDNIELFATPIKNSNSKTKLLDGYLIEWLDLTEQVAIEKEYEQVLTKTRLGDTKQRITIKNKEGFNKKLAYRVNEVLGVYDFIKNDITSVMNNLSNLDFENAAASIYNGELSELSDSINFASRKINSVIKDYENKSNQINSQNKTLSESLNKSEEQNKNLIATVNESKRVFNKIFENSELNTDLLTSIDAINSKSNKISKDLDIIEDLLSQINLISMNAAVEATKSGETGKGFGIVAAEIRSIYKKLNDLVSNINYLTKSNNSELDISKKIAKKLNNNLLEINHMQAMTEQEQIDKYIAKDETML